MIASAKISKLSMQDSPNIAALKQAFRKETDPVRELSLGIVLALAEIVLLALFFLPVCPLHFPWIK